MPQTYLRSETLAFPALSSLPPLSRLFVALGLKLARWETRSRGRRALTRLDDRLLSDIGLHPLSRDVECQKPFWRG